MADAVVGRWTTDLKVSVGEGSNPVIDVFHNSVSGMILKFVENIITMFSEWSMIFSIQTRVWHEILHFASF